MLIPPYDLCGLYSERIKIKTSVYEPFVPSS